MFVNACNRYQQLLTHPNSTERGGGKIYDTLTCLSHSQTGCGIVAMEMKGTNRERPKGAEEYNVLFT